MHYFSVFINIFVIIAVLNLRTVGASNFKMTVGFNETLLVSYGVLKRKLKSFPSMDVS